MLMPADHPVPRILYVASGPAPLAVQVLGLLKQRFPEHQIDLVVTELCVDHLPPPEREHVAFVAGNGKGRLAFIWRARHTPYWLVAVLLSGQPGFLTMKLAAVLIGAGRVVVCFNEHADAFALDRRHTSAIAAFLGQRLGARGNVGRGFARLVLRAPYTVVGEPVGLAWMTLHVLAWRASAWLCRRD